MKGVLVLGIEAKLGRGLVRGVSVGIDFESEMVWLRARKIETEADRRERAINCAGIVCLRSQAETGRGKSQCQKR